MKVKEFVAPTLPEALTRVRRELGPDAYIISTAIRSRRQRFWSRERASEAVVTAALPHREEPNNRRAASVWADAGDPNAGRPSAQTLPFPWRRHFQQAGWEEEMLGWIEKEWHKAAKSLAGGNWEQTIRPWLAELLVAGLKTSDAWLEGGRPGRVVVFVGPPRAGKTAMVEKIAQCYLGIAQWRVVTFPEPPEPAELEAARAEADLVLVDTPGLSLNPGPENKGKVWQDLERLAVTEVQLVLPAECGGPYLARLLATVAPLHPTHLAISRMDEVGSWLPVYSLARRAGLPLRFVSTGPDDPQQLEVADLPAMVEAILAEVDREWRRSPFGEEVPKGRAGSGGGETDEGRA